MAQLWEGGPPYGVSVESSWTGGPWAVRSYMGSEGGLLLSLQTLSPWRFWRVGVGEVRLPCQNSLSHRSSNTCHLWLRGRPEVTWSNNSSSLRRKQP